MADITANISWAACHSGLTTKAGAFSKHTETILTAHAPPLKLRCVQAETGCAEENTFLFLDLSDTL